MGVALSQRRKAQTGVRRGITAALLAVSGALRTASNGFTAVAAGVCGVDDLVNRTQEDWDSDRNLGLLEAPNVFAGLMEWEKPIVGALAPNSVIGIVGCGAGRDLIPLARMGFTVDGLDISPRAIRLAKEFMAKAGVSVDVYCADATEFTFPRERYDAFIFSWFTYSYIPHTHRRVKALANLRDKLSPEGHVTLSFHRYNGRGIQMSRIAAFVGRLTFNADPPRPGDDFGRSLSYQHHFKHEEVVDEARAAGYDVVAIHDGPQSIAVLKKAGS
jgi:2-polyprenyl-3-methyl-5-hydroxy-6-metoxy-1,4-benzoquinol methylase